MPSPLDGVRDSQAPGWQEGYEAGLEAGRAALDAAWAGTSIIIPTYNKSSYLLRCLRSVIRHTPQPYEIIVVDNASTDGTSAMLAGLSRQLQPGMLRFRVMESNLGFAGAVNRGLMMARGDRLLLLNNDTLVTESWLGNLNQCLERSPAAGIVGPVTNIISGSQRIPVPYRSLRQMQAWARSRNISAPESWRETERLTGFCMLMRRSLLQEIGYFDEGFRVGNYEDDDFGLRARLLSKRLYIAEDCFIHHFGSVTVRSKPDIMEITRINREYYHSKWEDQGELLPKVMAASASALEAPLTESSFYPGGVAAEGPGGQLWWLENGSRWRMQGGWELPVARLSRPALSTYKQEPETIAAQAAACRWRGEQASLPGAADIGDPPHAIACGSSLIYVEQGSRRSPLNRHAAESWGLHHKPARPLPAAILEQLPQGRPILAPPMLDQRL